jgi:hypothetical protein
MARLFSGTLRTRVHSEERRGSLQDAYKTSPYFTSAPYLIHVFDVTATSIAREAIT